MELKNSVELQEFILHGVERTGKILGRGSFGYVEEMKYDHAPCAGKIIHAALIDSHNMGAAHLIRKFEQECKLMKELRFPHIVQFVGLCFFEDCTSPVIVMELLNSNVEQWLRNSKKELPLSLKSSILRDTAKGLHHLHSHKSQIIHRDLTARNVLLTKSMVPKIADLGNACIIPPYHLTKVMTSIPGTIPYMPPEAFHPDLPYTEKLDIFSFGHLALYTMIQEEPYALLPPTHPDPIDPEKVLGRSEIERRKNYLDNLYMKFASSHDISSLIQQCLNNNPSSRPSASQIVKAFDDMLKECSDEYTEYEALNRYDIAQKLREIQDTKGLDSSGGFSKVAEVKEKVMLGPVTLQSGQRFVLNPIVRPSDIVESAEWPESGQRFILEMYGKKPGKFFHKGTLKWRKYTFCYTSGHLQYYTDLNKDPIQVMNTNKIESVKMLDDFCDVFLIQFKGNEQWTLKASSKEEALAWLQALKKAPPINLPAPPPPTEDSGDTADYEPIHGFFAQHKKENYELINFKSRNPIPEYVDTHAYKKTDTPEVLKQVYKQNQPHFEGHVGPEMQATLQLMANDQNSGTPALSPERRLSRMCSTDQLEKLLEVWDPIVQAEDDPQQTLYDDIAPSLPQEAILESSHYSYVDMDAYDTIPPKKNFYFNIDDTPPVPPKPPPKDKLQPVPRARIKIDTAMPGKKSSSDDILMASAKVSTDMLVLGDDDDNVYELNPFMHRPDWAKARTTVATSEEMKKYGLEDEMLSLLDIDPSLIYNRVEFAVGQFGKVYRATLKTAFSEDVRVAIKCVKNDTNNERETAKEREAFIREMSVMSRMLHPNIVRLHGLIFEENSIVLEYMDHGDLGAFLKKHQRPVSKLIMYMIDIALGMHHLSNLGLVHRDLAARNVLVARNETCKVADFGLLRQIDEDHYMMTGASKVPIRWCAPECLEKHTFYPASDVWSYAIVLWEMAHPTEMPYKEYEDYTVASAIMGGTKLAMPDQYPEVVKKIMTACWCLRPEKRPSFQYITMLLTKLTLTG